MREYLLRTYSKPYYVSDTAPDTYQALRANTDTLTVWSGASDNTIFIDPSLNHLFRAWHDSLHIQHNLDFTIQGELLTATIQIEQASRLVGDRFATLIEAETRQQTLYYAEHGVFPEDQGAFTEAFLRLKGVL